MKNYTENEVTHIKKIKKVLIPYTNGWLEPCTCSVCIQWFTIKPASHSIAAAQSSYISWHMLGACLINTVPMRDVPKSMTGLYACMDDLCVTAFSLWSCSGDWELWKQIGAGLVYAGVNMTLCCCDCRGWVDVSHRWSQHTRCYCDTTTRHKTSSSATSTYCTNYETLTWLSSIRQRKRTRSLTLLKHFVTSNTSMLLLQNNCLKTSRSDFSPSSSFCVGLSAKVVQFTLS